MRRPACPRCKPSKAWCGCRPLPLDELLAAASAGVQSLEETRAILGARAGYTLEGKTVPVETTTHTRVRPPAAIERAERERVAAAGEESTGYQARPRKRAPAPSATRGAYLTQAAARGTPHQDGLDWLPQDFATMRALEASAARAFEALCTVPPIYARRLQRAALGYVRDENGRLSPTRSWEHIRARRIVALGVVMWRASRSSKRAGMSRILVGRTRGMIANLTRSRIDGKPLSISMLFGTQHHGTGSIWDCGDIEAIERAGAIWAHQPPAACVPVRFRGRDRDGTERAFSEYHFTERVSQLHGDDVDDERDGPPVGPAVVYEPRPAAPPPQ